MNLTMASKGQASVCFSCGQPLPRDLPPLGELAPPPVAFPLTGAMPSPLEPPPNPYGAARAESASIVGASGQFAIQRGVDVCVGRDPARCPVALSEPRVSGVHATLRLDAGVLMVRDEGSNNGTHVNGVRIPAGVFTPVSSGAQLRFGPIEFTVRIS